MGSTCRRQLQSAAAGAGLRGARAVAGLSERHTRLLAEVATHHLGSQALPWTQPCCLLSLALAGNMPAASQTAEVQA